MRLALDIGGTHIRLAILEDDITEVEKYECSQFSSIEDALEYYCNEKNISAKGTLYISSAALQNGDGIWKFTNFNKWVFTHKQLKEAGWEVKAHYNDFYASACGAITHQNTICKQLKKGSDEFSGSPSVVIGPGSGLGLAYAHEIDSGLYIQETHGGHMLASALTDEHVTILKIINRLKTMQTLIVFEDVVSGRGLMNLYKAVSLYNGRKKGELTAKELIDNAASNSSDDIISDTLRLFHEFFGVFVHGVVISGNAYKGVFLDGGVYHALSSAELFDFERFQEFFILNPVEPVKQDLQKTAIFSVDTSYAALYGLKEMINNEL